MMDGDIRIRPYLRIAYTPNKKPAGYISKGSHMMGPRRNMSRNTSDDELVMEVPGLVMKIEVIIKIATYPTTPMTICFLESPIVFT